jgi:hypothetical protein
MACLVAVDDGASASAGTTIACLVAADDGAPAPVGTITVGLVAADDGVFSLAATAIACLVTVDKTFGSTTFSDFALFLYQGKAADDLNFYAKLGSFRPTLLTIY